MSETFEITGFYDEVADWNDLAQRMIGRRIDAGDHPGLIGNPLGTITSAGVRRWGGHVNGCEMTVLFDNGQTGTVTVHAATSVSVV